MRINGDVPVVFPQETSVATNGLALTWPRRRRYRHRQHGRVSGSSLKSLDNPIRTVWVHCLQDRPTVTTADRSQANPLRRPASRKRNALLMYSFAVIQGKAVGIFSSRNAGAALWLSLIGEGEIIDDSAVWEWTWTPRESPRTRVSRAKVASA